MNTPSGAMDVLELYTKMESHPNCTVLMMTSILGGNHVVNGMEHLVFQMEVRGTLSRSLVLEQGSSKCPSNDLIILILAKFEIT